MAYEYDALLAEACMMIPLSRRECSRLLAALIGGDRIRRDADRKTLKISLAVSTRRMAGARFAGISHQRVSSTIRQIRENFAYVGVANASVIIDKS